MVCEHFTNEADAERASLVFLPNNLYNESYFEAARSERKRSILTVCEHFANEADAKRASLIFLPNNLYNESYFEAARSE